MPNNFHILGHSIALGETADLRLPVSMTFTGDALNIPLRVVRAAEPGPVLCVTAAVHGDEINGTGVIHDLMFANQPPLKRGTLVLAPVVDLFGFETQSRYMPDRRDLNRCFPGSTRGSLSRRVAHALFHELIVKCDYSLDLHSAATGRTNFPNVRADLDNKGCRQLAKAFGTELIVNGKGPEGSLRRAAVKAGVPCVILEAGEPCKIEPTMLEIGVRGVHNVLSSLEMIDAPAVKPLYQARVHKTQWVRASAGGLLRFHVGPGDLVEQGEPISTNVSVFGDQQATLIAPFDSIVLGMTTLPVVKPGEPVAHLATLPNDFERIKTLLAGAGRRSLGQRLRRDLATNMHVTEAETAEELTG